MIALLIDRLLGEPQKYHPLVMWGDWVTRIERRLNQGKRSQGFFAWCLLVMPPVLVLLGLLNYLGEVDAGFISFALTVYCLYFSIGWQSLRQHGRAVRHALNKGQDNGLDQAREKVGRMVSRNTEQMDKPAIIRACIESLFENGADAIFAPLFWFVVGGPAAAVAYRLANTLDAMWGYKTERYNQFGWWSAKADDVLNYIPARLTALSYAYFGDFNKAINCWRRQAQACASPNGGPVMCAGAGSLAVVLGGEATYHGQTVNKPIMGEGQQPQAVDISEAIRIIDHSVYAWAVVVVIGAIVFA